MTTPGVGVVNGDNVDDVDAVGNEEDVAPATITTTTMKAMTTTTR